MGCFCDHPYRSVQCNELRGDPHLWSAATVVVDLDSGQQIWITLYDLCLHLCFCSSATKRRAARNETGRLQNSHKALSSDTNGISENRVGNEFDRALLSSSPTSQQGTEASTEHSPLESPPLGTCGSSCTSGADCQGGTTGCTCKTQKESYVMGKRTANFLAACMISLGGKREEDTPCPCNVSYVSYACCGSKDGLVWENETFKLGELLVHHENEN